jgi:hypothetical protein
MAPLVPPAARALAAAAAAGLIGWIAFGRGDRVPLLGWIGVAFHEFGHVATTWAPEMAMFLAGSVAQVLIPLLIALYFGVRRDLAAAGLCLAWAGTAAQDASVYIADAPHQALPLLGGGQHDWAYILGPEGFDAISRAAALAAAVRTAGLVLLLAGVVVCLVPAIRWVARRTAPDAVRPGPPAG